MDRLFFLILYANMAYFFGFIKTHNCAYVLRYSFYALYLSSASIPISLFSDFAQGQANADNGQYNADQAEEDCNTFHSLQSG